MQDQKILGRAIQQLRNNKGLTQDEVARRMGKKGPSGITAVECGHRSPRTNTLGAILEAIGATYAELQEAYDHNLELRAQRYRAATGNIFGSNRTVPASKSKLAEKIRKVVAKYDAGASEQ